ncbi:MAG: hypothetical protein JXB47_08330 [Anaerolineae bacterium]|nr:hypothetical protein [Anaerolineae bacterium]
MLAMLKATKDINVTCEAYAEIGSQDEQIVVRELMDDLCVILSLAMGCHVEWIYQDFLSSNGEFIGCYCRGVSTSAYTPLKLIGTYPPEDIKEFVEQVFGRFRQQKEVWSLFEVTQIYLDAKSEKDVLPLRGLKLATLIEFLKTCYLERVNKTLVLGRDFSNSELRHLKREMKEVLCTVFGDRASDRQVELMLRHVQGLKWYPFRQALRDIFQCINLSVSSKELGRFVDNRNELVHRAKFISKDFWKEYAFMMNFINKILLAILGYKGHYNDWTLPADEMRVAFALKST